MNPVLILTHNNLDLTKRAVESVRNQDIEPCVYVIDNGSTDGTKQWLPHAGDHKCWVLWSSSRDGINLGVSHGWNSGLDFIFNGGIHLTPIPFSHILVLNNDVSLPPWFYRELRSYDVPFVSGIAVDSVDAIKEPAQRMSLQPTPDFSAFLIRRDCWEKVGPFDERMKLYASDCDFHVRAHRLGIPLWKANVPFYHERSSTLNLASPEERTQIEAQANADREVFRSIYGCLPGTPEYQKLFE